MTKQADVVKTSVRNAKSKPVIIAPTTLAAAKVMASNITEVNIVPNMPVIKAQNTLLMQRLTSQQSVKAAIHTSVASATTATPKATHKNAVPTVITAAKLKTAVMAPTIILIIIDIPTQLFL